MKRFIRYLLERICFIVPVFMVERYVSWLIPHLRRRKYERGRHFAGLVGSRFRECAMQKFGCDHIGLYDVPFGYRMFIPVTDNHLVHRRFGVYHPESLLHVLREVCKPGDTVCELGTHLGEMTLFLAQIVGKNGKVYAFEGDFNFCHIVQQSLDANNFSHVMLENFLVGNPGDTPTSGAYGDLETAIKNFPELNGASALGAGFFTAPLSEWNVSEIDEADQKVVERVDICKYFENSGDNVDVFFMDIEGCEVYAIPMILKLIPHSGKRPVVIFEIHHNQYSGEQSTRLREMLLNAGYTMSTPDDRHIVCV